ncbi:hypothetical protein GXM_00315 [Nostoc sphaeroides CCNUC1]|uniref:Uncharacterized protein n=1 Tax=Nostoc sphaeroides CCNUC1 TaxID=2653204 RepID=A0A5P8VQY2_9NOSO|nr:hypothetical protein GXM_00315 [Nostoc sphaeroides CCNUC1]
MYKDLTDPFSTAFVKLIVGQVIYLLTLDNLMLVRSTHI